jgi:hypothetical protein
VWCDVLRYWYNGHDQSSSQGYHFAYLPFYGETTEVYS